MNSGLESKSKKKLFGLEISMIVLAVIWFIPIYYLLVTTFKSAKDATDNPLSLPHEWLFSNYTSAWEKMEFPRAFGNTLIITVCSVVILIILSSMVGYALARSKTKISNGIFLFFIAGLVVPFQMNIVSLYKVVKMLGLMNSLAAVIFVNIAINLPQAIFLFKEFIESTIPIELEEAAEVDGAGVLRRFFQIVFPLLTPVISTVAIITTLNVWNEFMTPLLFLQTRDKGVILQEVSRNIGQFSTDWTALFPMMMLGVAPLIVFYLFMQKYIIAGVSAGAVKG
ncbi:carbohydrate ABC transporter permease [Enterococcus sp. LJL120]